MIVAILLLVIVALSITVYFLVKKKEKWCNGYSGWPGPIENGNGRYNIPALYGNPKYENRSPNCGYNKGGRGPYATL